MKNTEKIKNVLNNYRKVAQAAEAKIREAENVYKPDEAEKRIADIKRSLAEEKNKAQSVIAELAQAGRNEAKAWGQLDGDKITSDYKLLEANAVNQAKFSEMVEKYRDNGTMSHLLSEYAERRNAAMRAESKDPLSVKLYDAGGIMTEKGLTDQYNREEKSALSLLNMIDGGYLGGASSSMVEAAIEHFGESIGA